MIVVKGVITLFALVIAVSHPGTAAVNVDVDETHHFLRHESPGDRDLVKKPPSHITVCSSRCRSHCFGKPNSSKCASRFVTDHCKPFSIRNRKIVLQKCLAPSVCVTGQRTCPDGSCVAAGACCPSETKCPDGTCVSPPTTCQTKCNANECVNATVGGTINVTGLAKIEFDPGMFEVNTVVKILKTQDPTMNVTFDATASIFRPKSRLSYELVVNLSGKPQLPDIPVTMDVPSGFASSVASGDSIEVFYLIEMESMDDGPTIVFELLPESAYDSSTKAISFILPAIAFIEKNGQYRATITLAPTPGATSRRERHLSSGVCHGSSIRCPVQGGCTVTSPFSLARTLDGVTRQHYGTDYKATEGMPILAAAKGVIERISYEEGGYGNYMILRHEDKSATLYAHLKKTLVSVGNVVEVEQQIALAGSTGRSTGPHLHLELVPNGEIIKSKNRIDPDPCIGMKSQGSITAGDNGSAADDSFKLTLNGVVLGTTTIGGSNTLSINNLIPGTFPLTLEVVLAPDDIGTWYIQLNDGLKFEDGTDYKSSSEPQGTVLTFNVVVPGSTTTGWTAALIACSADPQCAFGRLKGGTTKSYEFATAHLPLISPDLETKFAAAAQEFDVPLAVVKALASRETNMGSYLGSVAGCPPGYGDAGGGCNGFGILQVDKRFHVLEGANDPFSLAHIRQAVGIFKDFRAQVMAKEPDWAPKFQLKGGAVAYNSGLDNVQSTANMDGGTAENDYGSDVMTRAIWFLGKE